MNSRSSSLKSRADRAAARVRELAAVGIDLVQLREVEPLEREVVVSDLRARVGQHPVHLRGQHVGLAETRCSPRASAAPSSGRLLQRKNDRRDASSRSLSVRVARCRRDSAR